MLTPWNDEYSSGVCLRYLAPFDMQQRVIGALVIGVFLMALVSFISLVSVPAHADGMPMRLIAPGVGWTMDNGRLYWTNDNGATWALISPKSKARIQDVFFQDALTGWVLLSQEEEDGIGFSIAITDNSGQSWSVSPIPVKQRPDELDGKAWVDFVDRTHGWLLLHGASSSAFSWGRLLATNDGGETWQELSRTPIADRPTFTTVKDGWISGNAGGGGVFRTHDGGLTWQGDGPPTDQLPATFPTRAVHGNVTFTDRLHGFLPVTLLERTDAEKGRGTAFILYATDDGGQTWKIDRSFSDHKCLKNGASFDPFGPISLIPQPDNKVVLRMAVHDYSTRRLTMKTSTREETLTTSSAGDVLREHEQVLGCSFIGPTQGWVAVGRLLATEDGGVTWKDISPIPKAAPPIPTGRKYRLKPTAPGPKF